MICLEIGKVIGNLWATKKDEGLNGEKLLILKILDTPTSVKEGILVASDHIGAGTGELVLVSYGSSARNALGRPHSPVDAAVIGIVDSIEIDRNDI